MQKVLVSACLLGEKVRYDGSNLALQNKILRSWITQGRVVPVCPEVSGGLPIPRTPAEITGGDGWLVLSEQAKVLDREGKEVTSEFLTGAELALSLCRQHDISVAVLTENSPSCGSSLIYDGSFSGAKLPGTGVTTALLRKHGVDVFSQHEIAQAASHLKKVPPQ